MSVLQDDRPRLSVPLARAVDRRSDRCPRCGSSRVTPQHSSGKRITVLCLLAFFAMEMHPLIGLLVLICGLCFLFTTRYRTCEECNHLWRDAGPRGFDVVTHEKPGNRC